MIGKWMEQLDDVALQSIADAQAWCAFTSYGPNDSGCVQINAGFHEETEGDSRWRVDIASRYDQLVAKRSGSTLFRSKRLGAKARRSTLGRHLGPGAAPVETVRRMIQNRARNILATRALSKLPATGEQSNVCAKEERNG